MLTFVLCAVFRGFSIHPNVLFSLIATWWAEAAKCSALLICYLFFCTLYTCDLFSMQLRHFERTVLVQFYMTRTSFLMALPWWRAGAAKCNKRVIHFVVHYIYLFSMHSRPGFWKDNSNILFFDVTSLMCKNSYM